MLWLLVLLALTWTPEFVRCEGSGDNNTEIIAGSVVGGVVLIAILVVIIVLCVVYWHRRVTSLEYVLASKNRDDTRRKKEDEKSRLMSHEYDTVAPDEDLVERGSSSSRRNRRTRTPERTLESQYSEIRREFLTSHSRSVTPTDTPLAPGLRDGSVSYGAVSSNENERYDSLSGVERERRNRLSTPGSNHYLSTDIDGSSCTNYSTRPRVSTTILQSLKHSKSGMYVPTTRQRTDIIIEDQTVNEEAVYDRLARPSSGFFETEKKYWCPALTTTGLYTQFSVNKYREIPRKSIVMLQQVGAGEFGKVYKGLWMCEGDSLCVAVKALQDDAIEEDRVKFLQEAAMIGQFSHSNIIRLYGVVTVTPPALIVLELALTDLRQFLCGMRFSEQYSSHLPRQLLQFSRDIACGMEYLSRKSFVHRDLAARNILLDFSLVCKIGDFGMARNLVDENYYSLDNRPLPVKWMAPEALLYRKYSTYSDVWSYGMVLYEIWSVGRKPHEDLTNKEVIENIDSCQCHPPPTGCPRHIYSIMVTCWNPEARERPKFQELYKNLSQPEEYLLSWSEEEQVPLEARQLGADSTNSTNLHLDLQNKYIT